MKKTVLKALLSFAVIFVLGLGGYLFAVKRTDVQNPETLQKPVIGLSGNLLDASEYLPNLYRSYVDEYYVEAVAKSGGIPIIIPINDDLDVIDGQVAVIDGLILTGGADVNPTLYGEKPYSALGNLMPRRDEFDKILLEGAIDKKIPVLGICRGHQFINVLNGGTLYQDIPSMTSSVVKHRVPSNEIGAHAIHVKKDTWLHKILGDNAVVNSFHHQAIKKLAPGSVISATTKDGMIESVERINGDGTFCIGIQWHPERMFKKNESMRKLLKEFIKVCGKNR
jgi:putative glutamine amidotransferase